MILRTLTDILVVAAFRHLDTLSEIHKEKIAATEQLYYNRRSPHLFQFKLWYFAYASRTVWLQL